MKKLIVGVLFLVVGGGLALGLGKPVADKANASTEWPTTQGTIVVSGVDEKISRRRRKRSFRRTTRKSYSAHVVYEYEVDGQHFESDNIWYGSYSSSSRSSAQKLAAKYPVDTQVEVYYMPGEPSESVLMPGAFFSSYIMLIVGSVFAGVGLLLCAGPMLTGLIVGAGVATVNTEMSNHDRYADSTPDRSDEAIDVPQSGQPGRSANAFDEDDGFGV